MNPIKTIIFDLDDTLFDSEGQCVQPALSYAITAMKQAGLEANDEEALLTLQHIIKQSPSQDKFKLLNEHYNGTKEIYLAGRNAYYSFPLPNITLFSGVNSLLEELKKDYLLALVTYGDKKQQQEKINKLGIEHYFTSITLLDKDTKGGKEESFLDLIDELGIKQGRILIVGDRTDSEIRVGNKLGMTTVQILHGKYKGQEKTTPHDTPDYEITTITELKKILEDIKTMGNKLSKGPRIALIGAGTGVPSLVEGLKKYTHNLSCIINIIDEGRSSGILRKELGMPPPGDIRNNLVALAGSENLLHELFQYRFSEGSLTGHSFGNLFLAAMTKVTGNFQTAIKETSKILDLKGEVYPASLQDVKVGVVLEDGTRLVGEQEVVVKGDRIRTIKRSPIQEAFLEPKDAQANPDAVAEILRADLVTIGPGSLFSSVIPNILLPEIQEALKKTKAKIVYVCNIMTQPGQTEHFTASDHLQHIIKYVGKGVIDYVVLNGEQPSQQLLDQYAEDNSYMVKNDLDAVKKLGVEPLVLDVIENLKERKILWEKVSLLRHDSNLIAEALMKLLEQQ